MFKYNEDIPEISVVKHHKPKPSNIMMGFKLYQNITLVPLYIMTNNIVLYQRNILSCSVGRALNCLFSITAT